MTRKLTQEEIINKFVETHGTKYDYSKVCFTKTNDKVEIVCEKHGSFMQSPISHIKGSGCSKCGKDKLSDLFRKPLNEFIEDANKVHNGKYDYSLVEYKRNRDKIKIICHLHGEFAQIVSDHMQGSGCKKCQGEETSLRCRESTESFIQKAKEIHGDTYDYSLVKTEGNKKIKIICKEHGIFLQSTREHKAGKGCITCGKSKFKPCTSQDKVLAQFKDIHGDTYDYSKVEYIKNKIKVDIICKIHGVFSQTPSDHKAGKGCMKCGHDKNTENLKLTTQDFITNALSVHGDKYDYSKSIYTSARDKVEILCKIHGSFFQSPCNHTSGAGCPECADSGYKTTKNGYLYVIKSGDFTKIGITNKAVNKRVKDINRASGFDFRVITSFHFKNGIDCLKVETNILRELHKIYKNPEKRFAGSSETFRDVPLEPLLDMINKNIEEVINQ